MAIKLFQGQLRKLIREEFKRVFRIKGKRPIRENMEDEWSEDEWSEEDHAKYAPAVALGLSTMDDIYDWALANGYDPEEALCYFDEH